ncbi:serine hydrolase domain-containing protein [Pandoraea bronchicola]|uniref:Beta-lactamase n=1 Tax=Pandoraea bronchicola TaxID=2508287 RepID=A0A5E5BNW3_9BURK|nr:serine hydrolase domain-containing protein [Pandoraea bronchicola]VVE86977.1 beta-lactamase [Pandoraea bronchicola]
MTIAAFPAPAVRTSPPQVALIQSVVADALDDGRLVGAVVLVARRGALIHQQAAGFAERERAEPMALGTLFRLASVTKPIVCTAALVLMAQGRLHLTDDVTRWLPEFAPKLADGTTPRLSVRHLMTHTAGLTYGFFQEPDGTYAGAGISDGMDDCRVSLRENVRRIASVPLLYSPGTEWRYSIATDVLGAVIEAVTQSPLDEAVATLVTAPLGMRDTAFAAVDAGRLACAYADGTPVPRRLAEPDTVPFVEGTAGFRLSPGRALNVNAYPSGGAGMVGSASDFLLLLETLRKGGAPLLPEALVREFTTDQIGGLPMAFWPGRGFGLGVTVLKDPAEAQSPESAGTWRMGGTYGHSWFVDPARELSVVAFTNTALEGMSGRFVTDLRDAVYASLEVQE